METSALLKTHLFQTNLSRDSGLTSSDTQLYSEHMEPHAIPAIELQVRKKSLTRSTSQFDEVKPKQEPVTVLSNSYDSSLNVARECGEIPPPVPPPRKSRRKAPDPPTTVRPFYQGDDSAQVQLNVDSNEQTDVSTSSNTKPNLTITKQRSSESIGSSLDDYSGSIESGDFPDGGPHINPIRIEALQCNDMGELRKSASGAKIYLDEQLLSDSVSRVDHGQNKSSPTVTNSSILAPKQSDHKVSKRTPPPMREPPSYEESVLRARGKAAEIRAKTANRHSWNVSPERPSNGQQSTGSTPNRSHRHETNFPKVRSNHKKQGHADPYSSVDNLHQASQQSNVADRYSSMQELHNDPAGKQSEGAYIPAYNPIRRGSEGTPQQMMYAPPEPKQSVRDPVLKTLMVEGVENKEEVLRKVRVGMTAKGGDIFPKHMRSIIRHSLHEEELIARNACGRGMRKTGSFDDESSHARPQRSESFATRQKPQQIDRLAVPRSVEKSASDTSVVDQFENNARRHGWKRPSKPPTYQEAIQRKSLLKSGLPLYQVSQQDVKQQREKSSKAAQLYQDSMKRYQLQADDPSDDRRNEGHVTYEKEVEVTPQPQPQLACQNEMPFKRPPPPTRQIDHPKRNTREDDVKRQSQSADVEKYSRREITPPSDDQKSRRQHYTAGEEDRHRTELQRHSYISQHSGTEQIYSARGQREQGRNSDPRSKSVNDRIRRDHSNVLGSENESDRNFHIDEYKIKREHHTTRQQTPPYQQNNNKEKQHRRSKPRDQRLSDTRLENNKTKEFHRQHKSGLTRSKSDSSEHLNKIGRFKELQALDSNIIEHYRKSKLNAENEALKDSEGFFVGRSRRRSVNSVRNRDWHKDLAEQYSDMFYMPPQEPNNNKVIYSYAGRQQVNNENQEEERPKKRWQPPVHPSKDLVVVNNNNQLQEKQNSAKKDKGRRSMPANFTNWSTAESNREQTVNTDKENKPANVAGQDRRGDASEEVWAKNVRERIAEYPARVPSQSERHNVDSANTSHQRVLAHQHHVLSASQAYAPKQSQPVKSKTNVHQYKQVHPSQNVPPHLQRDAQVRDQAHATSQVRGQMHGPPQIRGQAHAPAQVRIQAHAPSQKDTRPQAHVQAQQEQKSESEAGLTWSVAKLRNHFSQGNSSNIFYDPASSQAKDVVHSEKKIANEATNADATEEYI